MTAALPDTTQAFLNAIRANLADDAPRLIYADCLDENGEAERAEFIRVQCEISSRLTSDGHVRDCYIGGCAPSIDARLTHPCKVCGPLWSLRRRERELWGYLPARNGILRQMSDALPGAAVLLDSDTGTGLTHEYPWATIRRGFVYRVSAPFGVLCGEVCRRYETDGWGAAGCLPDCESCHGTGRTLGVLREIVRSEVAAVEYVEATDCCAPHVQSMVRNGNAWHRGWGFWPNPQAPESVRKAFDEHYDSEAAARAALSRAMLEAV